MRTILSLILYLLNHAAGILPDLITLAESEGMQRSTVDYCYTISASESGPKIATGHMHLEEYRSKMHQ